MPASFSAHRKGGGEEERRTIKRIQLKCQSEKVQMHTRGREGRGGKGNKGEQQDNILTWHTQ